MVFFGFSLTRWEEGKKKKENRFHPAPNFSPLTRPPLLTFAYCLCALLVLGGDTLEGDDWKDVMLVNGFKIEDGGGDWGSTE